MNRTVAIVGSHSDTRGQAPFDDPGVDIWVFNEAGAHDWAKRVDTVFQMHAPAVYRNPENRTDRDHRRWLEQPHGFPIYMQAVDPDVPASVRYPLDEICAELLPGFTWTTGEQIEFFTSTIAYALALAIYQGYKRILMYGAEMASGTEYQYQRDCVTFWTGLALGRGIQVVQGCAAGIYDTLLYGYDGEIGLAPEYFRHGLAQLKADAEAAGEKREAAATTDDRMLVTLDPGFPGMRNRLLDWASEHGFAQGMFDEARRYFEKAQAMQAATGLAPFSRQEFETGAGLAQGLADKYRALLNYEGGRVDYVWQAWTASRDKEALRQLRHFSAKQIDLAYYAGVAQGKAEANRIYMREVDARFRMAGGEKAKAALSELGKAELRPNYQFTGAG